MTRRVRPCGASGARSRCSVDLPSISAHASCESTTRVFLLIKLAAASRCIARPRAPGPPSLSRDPFIAARLRRSGGPRGRCDPSSQQLLAAGSLLLPRHSQNCIGSWLERLPLGGAQTSILCARNEPSVLFSTVTYYRNQAVAPMSELALHQIASDAQLPKGAEVVTGVRVRRPWLDFLAARGADQRFGTHLGLR